MENILRDQSAAAASFEIRKSMRDLIAESQILEHNFYKNLALNVEHVTTRLCDTFSELIQNEILQWSDHRICIFAATTRLELNHVMQWVDLVRKLEKATADLQLTKSELLVAKKEQSKFSGIIWGAKSGHEVEFEKTTHIVNDLDKRVKKCSMDRDNILKEAQLVGEELLDHLVSNATLVTNDSTIGPTVKIMLEEAAKNSVSTLEKQRTQQKELIAKLQIGASKLQSLYDRR